MVGEMVEAAVARAMVGEMVEAAVARAMVGEMVEASAPWTLMRMRTLLRRLGTHAAG